MSREPRVPQGGPPDYRSKLDLWFVELARLFRGAARPADPDRSRTDVPGATANRTDSIRSVEHIPVVALPEWPQTVGEMLGLISLLPDARIGWVSSAIRDKMPQESLGQDLYISLCGVLSLLKYQSTFEELVWGEKHGDSKAGHRLVDIMDLCNRWLHEQLPPGGVHFKTNVQHNLLILYGLAAGLRNLTSSELVQFFDEMCPCGEVHSQQVLQRLRTKLQESVERSQNLADTGKSPSPIIESHQESNST